jgi:hypothetical protein
MFVSSYLPEPGESLSTLGTGGPLPFLDFDPDGGTLGARPGLFAERSAPSRPSLIGAGIRATGASIRSSTTKW